MLADSYTLGAGGDALVYTKQYDAADKNQYSVAGLAANAARVFAVSHTVNNKRGRRSLVDFRETDVDPTSATGATQETRAYLVLDRASFKSATSMESMRIRMKTFVDSSTMWAAVLNGEV